MKMRDVAGRFISRECPECDCGLLQYESDKTAWHKGKFGWWRCDGLTYLRDDSPLIACEYAVEGCAPAAGAARDK